MRTDLSREFRVRFLSCYRGFVFRWQRYRTLSSNWNHDHRKGCSARFAERPDEWADPVHTEGWVTLWPVANTGQTEEELVSKWRAAGKNLGPSPKLRGFQLDGKRTQGFPGRTPRIRFCSRSGACSVATVGTLKQL